MPQFFSARLQSKFLPIIIVFMLLVISVFAGALWYGDTSATVTVTPLAKPVTAYFNLKIVSASTADSDNILPATVTTEKITETVTVSPPAEGALVDAHAHGTMTVINSTSRSQPLVSGTRFRADNGVIVRSDKKIEVPAHGQATVNVIADPLGTGGEVPAGKFIIVALHTSVQSQIYGRTDKALTGGQIRQGSTLDSTTLNQASNEAGEKIQAKFGSSVSGVIRLLEPISVTTNPPATTSSESYKVTVTMLGRKIEYNADLLTEKIRKELSTQVPVDTELYGIEDPGIARAAEEGLVIRISARGTAAISTSYDAIQPATMVNVSRSDAISKILATGLVKNVTITMSPAWQKILPSTATKIKVIYEPPQT